MESRNKHSIERPGYPQSGNVKIYGTSQKNTGVPVGIYTKHGNQPSSGRTHGLAQKSTRVPVGVHTNKDNKPKHTWKIVINIQVGSKSSISRYALRVMNRPPSRTPSITVQLQTTAKPQRTNWEGPWLIPVVIALSN